MSVLVGYSTSKTHSLANRLCIREEGLKIRVSKQHVKFEVWMAMKIYIYMEKPALFQTDEECRVDQVRPSEQ